MTKGKHEKIGAASGADEAGRGAAQVVDDVLGVAAENVDVAVQHGVVFLEGAGVVPDAMERADTAARHLPGIADVVDDVYTLPPSPKTDGEVAHDVRAAIRAEELLAQPDQIRVAVRNGEVRLEGTVASVYERMSAVAAAKAVTWVVVVVDDLVVTPAHAETHQGTAL